MERETCIAETDNDSSLSRTNVRLPKNKDGSQATASCLGIIDSCGCVLAAADRRFKFESYIVSSREVKSAAHALACVRASISLAPPWRPYRGVLCARVRIHLARIELATFSV